MYIKQLAATKARCPYCGRNHHGDRGQVWGAPEYLIK